MTQVKLPEFVIDSRSAAEVDDKCGMAYWWSTQEGSTGIVPADEPGYLTDGRETHEDLATISMLPDDALTLEGLTELFKDLLIKLNETSSEALARRIGWAIAFGLYLEPRIRQEFTTVHTEAELVLDRDPYFLPIVPDRILEHRQDHYLVYREYKTTVLANAKWIASWQYMPQIHLGITAVQEELNRDVKYGQIMGLLKGDRNNKDKRLGHPFVWAYSHNGNWTIDYNKARGWDHARTHQYPGGLPAWIASLGADFCLTQFPHSYPIGLNRRLVDDWLMRREARMWQIESVRENCRADWTQRVIFFEPRTKQCRPVFGDECPYLKQCWNAAYNENPTLGGEMIDRVPHHELERIGFK